MMKNSIFSNLSPLNNNDNMSKGAYILKKCLAFFMIYGLAAIVGEGVIIGLLFALGYNPLEGVIPTGKIGGLLPYYGFIFWLMFTILYCKCIEKRNLKSIGFTKKVSDCLVGGAIAIALLTMIIGICCVTKGLTWNGFNSHSDDTYLVLSLIAFMIQGLAEEVLCRGFLMKSLMKKTSVPMAIIISSTAFAVPHFDTLFEAEFIYVVIGVINLYLISIIFSLLAYKRSNIWISCGLHSIWNFILYRIMGLSLSGIETNFHGVINLQVSAPSIINGGMYGVESSIITTIILGLVVFLLLRKGGRRKNGIQ